MTAELKTSNIFKARDITVRLKNVAGGGWVINGASIEIQDKKIIGLIGESGSGKSVFWKSVLGLLDEDCWDITGSAGLLNRPLDFRDKESARKIRGRDVAVILQDPMSAFDPIFTIETHFWETAKAHTDMKRSEVRELAVDALRRLYISNPERVLFSYPFQCSGGMLQRVMIAIAVMSRPTLLIADEPTTSVDITVHREILQLLRDLHNRSNTSILLISHDLRSVTNIVQEINVMYGGYLIERLSAQSVRENRLFHPYTVKLLQARPSFSKNKLTTIPGSPPALSERQSGCPFFPRCSEAAMGCEAYDMREIPCGGNHMVRCAKYLGNTVC